MMTFNKWFAGLVSAALSGGATSALTVAMVPELLATPVGMQKIGVIFAGGAIIGVLNYLKQSPLVEAVK